MGHRQRLGIRAQLTLIVLLAALLSTGATLFVANQAIAGYAGDQARGQAQLNTRIAQLVLAAQYGRNISIASDGSLVADSPTSAGSFTDSGAGNNFGKYRLDGDQDYVSLVQNTIGRYGSGYSGYVAMYKCGTPNGGLLERNGAIACPVITSTAPATASAPSTTAPSTTAPSSASTATPGTQAAAGVLTASACAVASQCLPVTIASQMSLSSENPLAVVRQVSINGSEYYANYSPLLNPQGRVIGVLMVGVPLDAVALTQQSTAIELVLVGIIIMIAGVIFALLFASAIVATLQRAARQVTSASENITSIATQQTGGSAQQVWAVNAINKALQTFTDTARDISERTDQLALMGNQVIQRRSEIAPAQIDQILGYMTRSVRDISLSTRQQVTQYERMTGAMQAVIEIAEQVAANSKEATESAARLDTVVGQLQDLVGVRRLRLHLSTGGPNASRPVTAAKLQEEQLPAVRVVRPQGQAQGLGMSQFPPVPPTGTTTGGVQINRNMAPLHGATGIGARMPRGNEALPGAGYPGARGYGEQQPQAPFGSAGGPESWLGLPPLPGAGPMESHSTGAFNNGAYGQMGRMPEPGAGGQFPWSQGTDNTGAPGGSGLPGDPGAPPWKR